MKEIDVNTDLEDEDGKTFTMYITKQLWHCFTAGRLTLKVLYALAFILKDHKTKPEIDKLMTITPVSNNCDLPSKNRLFSQNSLYL